MSTVVRLARQQHVSRAGIVKWLDAAKQLTGFKEWSLSCRVTTGRRISQLNRTYRDKEGPTDCLSFAATTWSAPEVPSPLEADAFFAMRDLGDLVLAGEVIESDAERLGSDREAHWRLIITHSFVHLLGHDHETEEQAGIMESRVEGLLQELSRLPLPRIAIAMA